VLNDLAARSNAWNFSKAVLAGLIAVSKEVVSCDGL
jgi:hypothetical protein